MSKPPPTVADWPSRRVLVTGADGFVGRWLVQALADKGAFVCALDRPRGPTAGSVPASAPAPRVECVAGDVTRFDFMRAVIADSRIDTVYHLAAINTNTGSNLSGFELFETNTRGVYTVLEACLASPGPVSAVLASSKEVEECFAPASGRKQHPYMASKAAAELIARAYNDTFDLPMVLVRSDNLYGGYDFNWSRLVPGTIRSILEGNPPVIRSDGLLRRDYVYVEDAVAAYIAIGVRMASPDVRGALFRVAAGRGTSVQEMVRMIARTAGRPDLEPVILHEKRDERLDTFYLPELEERVLGWRPRYSLEDGISKTLRWYQDYFRRSENPVSGPRP